MKFFVIFSKVCIFLLLLPLIVVLILSGELIFLPSVELIFIISFIDVAVLGVYGLRNKHVSPKINRFFKQVTALMFISLLSLIYLIFA